MQEEHDDLDAFLLGTTTTTTADSIDNSNENAEIKEEEEESNEEESEEEELEIVLLDESGNDIQPQSTLREALQLKPQNAGGIVDGDSQQQQSGTHLNQQQQFDSNGNIIDEVVPLRGHLNINGIGEFQGRKILEIDLDGIDDKPWRKPGADLTDYFNYGFNELSWRAYCIKQKQLREEQSLRDTNNLTLPSSLSPFTNPNNNNNQLSSSFQQQQGGRFGNGYNQQQQSSSSSTAYESGRRSRNEMRRSRSPPSHYHNNSSHGHSQQQQQHSNGRGGGRSRSRERRRGSRDPSVDSYYENSSKGGRYGHRESSRRSRY